MTYTVRNSFVIAVEVYFDSYYIRIIHVYRII